MALEIATLAFASVFARALPVRSSETEWDAPFAFFNSCVAQPTRPQTEVVEATPATRVESITQTWNAIHRPDKFDIASQAVERIANLPAGWDGGAEPQMPQSVIERAYDLLKTLAQAGFEPPSVYPTNCDTIVFDWESEAQYASLELDDVSATFLLTRNGERVVGESGHIPFIKEVLKTALSVMQTEELAVA